MKADLFNQKGKVVGDIEVRDDIFGKDVNEKVLAQYVYIYLSNQRQGNANTKNKAEVRGGGRKPWRQKGTGRARVGTIRSPIWRGGGVTHGPTSDVNWKKNTTKTFRRSAIANALSKMMKSNFVKFVDSIEVDEKKPLTKQALDIVNAFDNPKKITILTGDLENKSLPKSFSNLEKKSVKAVNELNAYDILNSGVLLIDQKALEFINKTW